MNMKTSPIKLNSKSKSKMLGSKSSLALETQTKGQNKRENSPIHNLGPKVSPNKQKKILSSTSSNNISKPSNSVGVRSGSPLSKMAPCDGLQTSINLRNNNSFYNLLGSQISQIPRSPQNTFSIQSPTAMNESMNANIGNSIKMVSDRNRMKVDLGNRIVGTNELLPTQRVVSPPKIVFNPLQKQAELERKVKILEMRINELYSEKNIIQTQSNQTNIRLQCENNMLKDKLKELAEKKPQTKRNQSTPCSSCQKMEQNYEAESQKLIKELGKSQENEYHQSKEIHSLKQKLSEIEEILSQQINKSLNLMEELKNKEIENEQFQIDIKKLIQQNSKLNEEMESMKAQLQGIEEQSSKTIVQALKDQSGEMQITKQLMNDLQQNNDLLLTAIRGLEASLQESHEQVSQLIDEKGELQSKLFTIQQAHKSWIEKDSYTLEQIESLSQKIVEIENELYEKNCQLEEKDALIKNQELKIQEFIKVQHDHEGNSSTAGSFYQKNSCDPCNKCDELRKTVIRLNSYLNKK